MKRTVGIITLLIVTLFLNAQKSIDALFEKYAGKNGFVTVTINGNLLRFAASFDDDDDNDNSMPKDITLIRILAQEDHYMHVENFYELVIKDIDLNQYEEFMQVKESDQDLKMLVRTEGKMFKEFLLIVGGKDNAIIQIKGNMSFDEAKKFADDAKRDHGSDFINR